MASLKAICDAALQGLALAVAAAAPVLLATSPALARPIQGFSGEFAPANWSIDATDPAFVDASATPDELYLSGPDDGSGNPELFRYSIPLSSDHYSLGFRWSYSSNDTSPAFDLFGYSLNGGAFEIGRAHV